LVLWIVDWVLPFIEEGKRAFPPFSILARERRIVGAVELLDEWFNVLFIVIVVCINCSVSDEI
jgi:hypothetical protein